MSNDSFTEVTSQSWFSRLTGAITGVLFGIVLFLISFPLLWWNEGRAVHTAKGLKEAGGTVASVSAEKVDPAQDKKLVYATGMATTTETLSDSQFGISEKAIKLRRSVAMYQWTEKQSSETQKKFGGGTETKTTYAYAKQWTDKPIDSKKFKMPDGHSNPDMRYETREVTAKLVTLGAMKLPAGLKGQMNAFEAIALDDKNIAKLPEDCKKQVVLENNRLYLPGSARQPAPDPSKPEIGDLRISFEVVRPGEVSVMARQIGDTFEPWQSSTGSSVENLMAGVVSPENMIGAMESQNNVLTWILRGVGFLLMFFGLALVFSPLVVLADVLPFLGDLLQMGVGLFAGLVAAALSLVTIAVAWIAYRPLLGVALLVAAVGLIAGLKAVTGRKRPAVVH